MARGPSSIDSHQTSRRFLPFHGTLTLRSKREAPPHGGFGRGTAGTWSPRSSGDNLVGKQTVAGPREHLTSEPGGLSACSSPCGHADRARERPSSSRRPRRHKHHSACGWPLRTWGNTDVSERCGGNLHRRSSGGREWFHSSLGQRLELGFRVQTVTTEKGTKPLTANTSKHVRQLKAGSEELLEDSTNHSRYSSGIQTRCWPS